MSLEAKIELLTEAVTRLIDALNVQQTVIVAPSAPAPQAQSVKEVAAPLVVLTPSATVTGQLEPAQAVPVVVSPSKEMPAPPVFVAPVVEAAPTGAPFTDGKGLIDYVMSAYKAMGAQKGAGIQNVLVSLGYQNINDVKPEHYGALFQGIEALKG